MEKQWKCYTQAFRDTWIRTLHSDINLQISDGTIPGLFLRYSAATRHIRFYLGCKIKNKKRNILLGQYGDFTIRDIRDRAWLLRHEIALGHDPIQDKKDQEAQQEKDRGELFCDLFPQYMDKYAKIYKKPKTQIANHAQYRLYIGPYIRQNAHARDRRTAYHGCLCQMGEKDVVCDREQGLVPGVQFLGLVRVVQVC